MTKHEPILCARCNRRMSRSPSGVIVVCVNAACHQYGKSMTPRTAKSRSGWLNP